VIVAAAEKLQAARLDRREMETLTGRHPGMTQVEAYAIQTAGIGLRLSGGEVLVGGKLGFTSKAMQRAMGVPSPNYGWMTDAMLIHDGVVPLDELIHPKVEPEIAFLLDADLVPPVSPSDVLASTVAVMPCLEVVDSRYVDFRFGPLDNIADNSSAALVILGDPHPVAGLDLVRLGVVVEADGALHATATGAAALDHPAAAVAWMVNNNTTSWTLSAGHIVISGGLTGPVDLRRGTVLTASFDRIGSVGLRAA